MTKTDLERKNLWKYFLKLETIPRESGNEEGVRSWLLGWAKEHGFEAFSDKAGNVFIRANATPGYENRTPVALQGHMDMVCVKRETSTHDFTKDPIEVEVDGDWLTAKDTSLGGDDGIAIAIGLDVLTDPACKHGPLELIYTVSEETGMDGANGLDGKDVRSRLLLNLDSENEGVLFIGCAGGLHTTGTLAYKTGKVPSGWKGYTLTVGGLRGGHSGDEIHKERANAIKVAARLLRGQERIMLDSFEGGTRMNVIPSSCKITFQIPEQESKAFEQRLQEMAEKIRNEYRVSDPQLAVTLTEGPAAKEAADQHQSASFIRMLFLIFHGVYAMSQTLQGLVETSSNLAIVSMKEGRFFATTSQRSSVESRKYLVSDLVGDIMRGAGMQVVVDAAYPSWEPDTKSKLAATAAKVYKEYTGKDMVVTAIHAGLECGIINSKVKGMDSVSFGPQMRGIHSVDEHLSISSSERAADYVKHLLSVLE